MRIQLVVFGFSIILCLLGLINLSSSYEDSYDDHQPLVLEYKRFDEIEKHCSKILSSGSKLELNETKVERIKKELSFYNGDWEQENNNELAPLMPFDVPDMLSSSRSSTSLKLINFEIRDVNSVQAVKNGVSLRGIMSIGITRSKSFSHDLGTMFFMKPGMSVLTIVFEGVYVETEGDEGERLLCMLGNTTLPSRTRLLEEQNLDRSHDDLMQDDQLMLVLKYPKRSSLTSRAIQGEMSSLHERRGLKYFDKVLISSQLGRSSDYQFGPISQLISCNLKSDLEELREDGANILGGSDFCRIFQEMSNEVFNILPDHDTNYNLTDNMKLGPFVLDQNEVMSVGTVYNNLKLIIQSVICEEPLDQLGDANVSAVFRVMPVHTDRSTTLSRSGLSGMTLLAEGTWDSSTGKLCMVGYVPKGMEAKVSMYFPRALSIKQRSIVFGSIEGLFSPLHLDVFHRPFILEYRYGRYADSLSYDYSKIKQADDFRKRSLSVNFIENLQQFILRYPTIQETGGFFSLSQIFDLTGALNIGSKLYRSIELEMVSIGPFLARYDFLYKVRHQGILADVKTLFNENSLLNVSLHLTISIEPVASASTNLNSVIFLSMEGLYDPQTGVMYLIGCGKVGTGIHVERGFDCLIEVKIQYPPTNTRWLRDPIFEISINSQRNVDDLLYFSPIAIKQPDENYLSRVGKREGDVAFRKIFEAVLRVVVLAVEIAIIWSQKVYMDQNVCLASSVSLHMFAIEVFSYSILLILGVELAFPSKETISYTEHAYDLHEYGAMLKGLNYAAKFLAFVVIFVNSRLFCMVSEARNRLNEEDPSKSPLALGDRTYFLSLFKRIVFVCLMFLITSLSFQDKKGMENVQVLMVKQLAELAGIMHDISLVPQITDNWRCKNRAKSLRKLYYVGLSVLKIMLKIYANIRSPLSDPYYIMREPAQLSFLLSINILGLISLVALVTTLHIQQNFYYFSRIGHLRVMQLLNPRILKQLVLRNQ